MIGMEEVSRDRDKWRVVVVAAMDHNGLCNALEEEEEIFKEMFVTR